MGSSQKANGDVHHLDHFVIAVMDPARAEKFYSDVLGAYTLKTQNAPNMTRIFMKLGENHVGLFSQGKATLPKRDSVNSYPRHSFQVPEKSGAGRNSRCRVLAKWLCPAKKGRRGFRRAS